LEERGTRSLFRGLALVGQLGFTVAGGIAAGLGGGWALDNWIGTRAVFKIAGLLLGLAGGVIAAYRLLSAFARDAGDRGPGSRDNGKHDGESR